MSYRVIVRGAPARRLVDVECFECGRIEDDVWEDEIPVCHGPMEKVWKHAPIVDAKMPFYVASLGKTFTTHIEMDRYAAANNKVVDKIDGRKDQSPAFKTKTTEERLAAGQEKAGLREIIKERHYRQKHGYKDFAPMTTEAQLSKETP
jgi:hypothetical protein